MLGWMILQGASAQTIAAVVLLSYGAILVAGGIFGWRLSGSRISLTASLASAALLATAYRISLAAPLAGYLLATAVALGLAIIFARRWRQTGNFLPSGLMLAVSVVAALLLAAITALSW